MAWGGRRESPHGLVSVVNYTMPCLTGPVAILTLLVSWLPAGALARALFVRRCSSRILCQVSVLALALIASVRKGVVTLPYRKIERWPGSYCDTKQGCCYPRSGKPAADFRIHGLWPNRDDGSYPQNCNPDSDFDASKVSDLLSSLRANWPTLACPSNDGLRFWAHEWEKHGTCAQNLFDEHGYFQAALRLRSQLRVLDSLSSAGISPDGGYYTLSAIKGAIQQGTGVEPFVECNRDESGNSQLYQIYFYVDASGSEFID